MYGMKAYSVGRVLEILYTLNLYMEGRSVMPRVAVEDNNRMSLRIPAEEKAILLRAAALKH